MSATITTIYGDAPASAVRRHLPELVSVATAAEILGMKPWPVVEMIEAGELDAVRYGRALLVRRDALARPRL